MASHNTHSTKVYWRSAYEEQMVKEQAAIEHSGSSVSGWVRDIIVNYIRAKRPQAFAGLAHQPEYNQQLNNPFAPRSTPSTLPPLDPNPLVPHPDKPGVMIRLDDLEKEGFSLLEKEEPIDFKSILGNPEDNDENNGEGQ